MAKWLAPVLGGAVLLVAAVVGVVVWAQGGDGGGSCDRASMATQMRDSIAMAEGRGQSTVGMTMPAHCGIDDMSALMPEVSRTWHMMPDGTMMRQPSHMPGSAASSTPSPAP